MHRTQGRNSRNLFTALAVAALLQGCASTMNEDECLNVDWRAVGFEDGARGEPAHRIGRHRKACAKYAVAPELEAYRAGRRAGLVEFCRPANGFRVGASGRSYAGACPATLETDFLAAYRAGRRLYDLERSLKGLDARIARHDRAIEKISTDIETQENLVVGEDASVLERAQALLAAKELIEQRERLEDERGALVADRREVRRELDDYRQSVAYNY